MLDELAAGDGEMSPTLRRRLAGAAFQRTARYDATIANWFAEGEDEFPDTILLGFDKHLEVSYGENPHQRGAYYAERGARTHLLARVEQLHGKPLSFNNLYDLDAARGLLAEFELPACVHREAQQPLRRRRGRRRRLGLRSARATATRCPPTAA